jgi:hypothetical protein
VFQIRSAFGGVTLGIAMKILLLHEIASGKAQMLFKKFVSLFF